MTRARAASISARTPSPGSQPVRRTRSVSPRRRISDSIVERKGPSPTRTSSHCSSSSATASSRVKRPFSGLNRATQTRRAKPLSLLFFYRNPTSWFLSLFINVSCHNQIPANDRIQLSRFSHENSLGWWAIRKCTKNSAHQYHAHPLIFLCSLTPLTIFIRYRALVRQRSIFEPEFSRT